MNADLLECFDGDGDQGENFSFLISLPGAAFHVKEAVSMVANHSGKIFNWKGTQAFFYLQEINLPAVNLMTTLH